LYKTDLSKVPELDTSFNFEIFCPTALRHDGLDLKNFTPIENVYFQPSTNVEITTTFVGNKVFNQPFKDDSNTPQRKR
jgi:hypothetical protein